LNRGGKNNQEKQQNLHTEMDEVPLAPSRAPAGSAAAPPPATTPWMQLLKPWGIVPSWRKIELVLKADQRFLLWQQLLLLLLQLIPIPRAETTRQRAHRLSFIMTSLPFRSVRVAIFIGSSCRRYYIHALLKLCNCKSVEQRNLWSTVHYSGYFNSVQNIY